MLSLRTLGAILLCASCLSCTSRSDDLTGQEQRNPESAEAVSTQGHDGAAAEHRDDEDPCAPIMSKWSKAVAECDFSYNSLHLYLKDTPSLEREQISAAMYGFNSFSLVDAPENVTLQGPFTLYEWTREDYDTCNNPLSTDEALIACFVAEANRQRLISPPSDGGDGEEPQQRARTGAALESDWSGRGNWIEGEDWTDDFIAKEQGSKGPRTWRYFKSGERRQAEQLAKQLREEIEWNSKLLDNKELSLHELTIRESRGRALPARLRSSDPLVRELARNRLERLRSSQREHLHKLEEALRTGEVPLDFDPLNAPGVD